MRKVRTEILIVSLYFLLSAMWVSISNLLKEGLDGRGQLYHMAQDSIFVTVTTLMLYMFLNRLYKTRDRLVESEEEIRGLFDSSLEMIIVVDKNFKIKNFNKRFLENYKEFYKREISRGDNYLEIYTSNEYDVIKEALLLGLSGQALEFERSVTNAGVTRWAKVSYSPIKDRNGDVTAIAISITDISKYKLALIELDESHSKLESIFNYSTDALFLTSDKDSTIVDCNATALKLLETDDKNQIIGKKEEALHANPVDHDLLKNIIEQIAGNVTHSYEFEYKTLKGNRFWGSFSGKSIKTSTGLMTLIRVTDVTNKRISDLKISETERKFRQLADSSPAMLWISDAEGKIIFYNQAWLQFRGITLLDEMDWGWKDGIHPDDQQRLIEETYNVSIVNKTGYTTEYRLKNKEGKYRWLLENAIPKFDSKGEFEGLYGSAIDISELREIQQQIIVSETKFRDLANTSPAMLWTADKEGDITFFNSAWLNFRGRSLEEEIGKGWIEGVHPDDIAPYVNNTYYDACNIQKSYAVEFRLLRYDGEYRWVFEKGTPKFNSEGVFEGMAGSVIDLTDWKAAELKLKQQEKFNSRISELSPDHIYIYDLILKQIIYSNRLSVDMSESGKAQQFFNERAFFESVHPDDLENVKYTDQYFLKLKDQRLNDQEFRLRAQDGSWKWIHTRETIFSFDVNGNPTQILGNARDITDRKLIEEEILKANGELKSINEELDSFVYRASHDLRAPLSSVLGLINLAKTEITDQNSLFYFDMMQKSIQKLGDVTQDLIDHARNSTMAVSVEQIDFDKMLSEIIEGMRFHEKASAIKFDITIEGKHEFTSDKLRLTLLFNNMISNAIKYHDLSKEQPFIKVHVTKNNKNAVIEVSDNGLGIEDEYQDKVFDMFFRANKTIPGTGLGLFIVKGALDKLKATIRLKSKIKEGTTFRIEIPNKKN